MLNQFQPDFAATQFILPDRIDDFTLGKNVHSPIVASRVSRSAILRAASAIVSLGLCASVLTISAPVHAQTTVTVTNSTDVTGAATTGSLRQVLEYAAANCYFGGPFTVNFAIGSGLQTIAVGSPLPVLTCQTAVNGYTQPGGSTPNTNPNNIGGSNAAINIVVDGGGAVTGHGIELAVANSQVRGLSVVGFATGAGVKVGSAAGASTVDGNFLGVLPNGTPKPNRNGVGIAGSNAMIGGATPAARNVVACNTSAGIEAQFASNANILNNEIGGKPDGTACGNGSGISMLNGSGGAVGGAGVGNFIRNSSGDGMLVTVTANFLIAGNSITANAGRGIYLTPGDCASSGVRISGNNIGPQGGQGIDLAPAGRDVNDALDIDAGCTSPANAGQNYPILDVVTYRPNTTDITFRVGSGASKTYDVEVFSNLAADVSDAGRGEKLRNSSSVTTDAIGFSPSTTLNVSALPDTYYLSMLATDQATGSTSEFSKAYIAPMTFAPIAGVAPYTITVGTPQTQALTFNILNAQLISGITVAIAPSGNFTIGSETCSASAVTPVSTCTVNITYSRASPTTGPDTATLTVSVPLAANTFTGAQTNFEFALTGTAVFPPAPAITSTSTASGVVGSPFTYNILASNTPTSYNAVVLPAGLSVNTSSGAITGVPTAAGSSTVTLSATNAGGTGTQPLTITIAAAPVAPTITFATTPTTMPVGGNTVGTMTITNSNTVPLTANPFTFFYLPGLVNAGVPNATSTCSGATITAAPGVGSYNQTTSFIIPASGSCSFSSTVTTGTTGTYTGAIPAGLIVTPVGSSGASNSVTLTVTAAPTPAVVLTPSSVNFGARTVSTTSPVSTVSLGNAGTALLTITSITASGDFGFTTTCPLSPSSLAVSIACPINITFTPLTAGALTGNITIVSNAPGSPHVIGLAGSGTAAAVPGISLAPAALAFGPLLVNTASATQSVVVTNTGFANLTLSGISVTTPFSRVPLGTVVPADCGTSVAPSSSCQIGVRFAPTGVGPFAGQISIVDNATGSPHTVALSGTGTPIPVPVISTNGAIVFGDQVINSTASVQSVTLGNTGTATLTISAITLTGTNAVNFTLTGQSGCTSIAPAGTCTLTVTFATTSTGAKTAQVNITSDAQNAALVNTVSLSGNGILAPRPIANLSMTAAGFGNVIFGGATPNQIITLSNGGGQAMTISSIVVVGDFVQSNNCGSSLASLASCTINVLFTPLGLGIRSGELIVTTSAASSPDRVPVSGTGCRWFSQSQSRFFLTNCG